MVRISDHNLSYMAGNTDIDHGNINDKPAGLLHHKPRFEARQDNNDDPDDNEGNDRRDLRKEGKSLTIGFAIKERKILGKEVDKKDSVNEPVVDRPVVNDPVKEDKKKDEEEIKRLEDESREVVKNQNAYESWINKPAQAVDDTHKNGIIDSVNENFEKYMGRINEYIKDPKMVSGIKSAMISFLTEYYSKEDNSLFGGATKDYAASLKFKLEPLLTNMNMLKLSYNSQFPTTQSALEGFSDFIGLPLMNNGNLDEGNFRKIMLLTPPVLNSSFTKFSEAVAIKARLSTVSLPATPEPIPAENRTSATEKPIASQNSAEKPPSSPTTPSTKAAMPEAPLTPPSFVAIPNERPQNKPKINSPWLDKLEKWLNRSPFIKRITNWLERIFGRIKKSKWFS